MEIIRQSRGTDKPLGQVLSAAFYDEPNFRYILTNEQKRQTALPWFFSEIVLRTLTDEIYTTPDKAGAAVWMRPGEIPTFNIGLLKMPFKFGWNAFRRSMQLSQHIDLLRKSAIQRPHWYLVALGVDPVKQGQGIGSQLIQPVLAHADQADAPCYLETYVQRNVRFYQKHGFIVADSEKITNELTLWGMVRESNPG